MKKVSQGWRFVSLFLLALVLTKVPYLNTILEWYNTFFHELSHGIGALITGGKPLLMELRIDGSGRLVSAGSFLPFVVTFMGYFGAVAWGALIYLAASRSRSVSNRWALLLAVVLCGSAVLWMRDWTSWFVAIILAVSFVMIWWFTVSRIARWCLQLIGLYLIATAIASAWLLFGLSGHNDATSLAAQTWVPAFIWIGIWILSGVYALWMIWRVESATGK